MGNENDNLEVFVDVGDSEDEVAKNMKYKDSLGGEDIVQLKGNHIPKGLKPLENFFRPKKCR